MLGQTSGPQRMTITTEGNDNVGILAEETFFPLGALIWRLQVGLNGREYQVYIDITQHQQEDKEATYVFLCMQKGKVLSICAEDDFRYILEVWMRWGFPISGHRHDVNWSVISRLLHCFPTHSSKIASPKKPLNTVRKPLAVVRKDFTFITQHLWPVTTIHPGSNATGFLFLPLILQHDIFGYWNMHGLFQLGAASCTTTKLATEYMTHWMELTIQCFFTDMQGFCHDPVTLQVPVFH